MTRKDYVSAASIIRSQCEMTSHLNSKGAMDHLRRSLTDAFAMFFRADNPAFNETRFRAACEAGEK
jgi:hypothetical protein